MFTAFVQLAVLGMAFGGVVIGGFWLLSKGNGGDNPFGIAAREFMAGLRHGDGEQKPSYDNSRPQHVEVMPMQRLATAQTAGKTSALQGSKPDKRMALVLLMLAVAYLVWPFDLLPDFLVGLGQVDDIGLLVMAIKNAINAFTAPKTSTFQIR